MDGFQQKTLTTSRGYTYTYYISPPTSSSNTTLPTLLFSHGWPDHAHMYEPIVSHLRALNIQNQILIPDQLGYGGTSKPTSASAYAFSGLTEDLISILDAESIEKVISIGHDWGSRLAARVYNYHPTRVTGLILLNVAYGPPQREPFDLDAVNGLTEKVFGYPVFAYWHLFAAPDGPQVLQDNVDRLYDTIHATGPDGMKRFFCVHGAIREQLTNSEMPSPEVRAYATAPGAKAAFVERLGRDGFQGPQNWYVATTENHQYESDRLLSLDRDRVDVPVLYIGCTDDAVCRPEMMAGAKGEGLLPDLEEPDLVDAAHWGVLERPEEMAGLMAEWILRKFQA